MKTQPIIAQRKIAIVHEMLVKFGGAEQVVKVLQSLYPQAPIYTLMYDEKKLGKHFPKSVIHPSCFSLMSQRIYSLTKKQRLCLPSMPGSIESLDFSEYDTVIVSSSAIAHGIITKAETKVIVYYHAPARYLWDWTHESQKQLFIARGMLGFFYKNFLKNLRIWDYIASGKNTIKLANSYTTQKRLQKYYRTSSQIVFPPVDILRFGKTSTCSIKTLIPKSIHSYYLIVSALTEFKKIDIAIHNLKDVFTPLIIVGEGGHKEQLEKISGDNVYFLGAKYGEELSALYQNALGIIFPGEEDFGIVPIEAMAAGKPVFALGKGGVRETVIAGKTGEFYMHDDGSDFYAQFKTFDSNMQKGIYKKSACKLQAEKYSLENFTSMIRQIVD